MDGFPRYILILGLICSVHVVPSQQLMLPRLLQGQVTSLRLTSLLGQNTIVNILQGIKDVGDAIVRRDFLLAAIKMLEIVRAVLRIVEVPGRDELDEIVGMIHGLLESVRPVLIAFSENTNPVLREEGNAEFLNEMSSGAVLDIFRENGKILTSLPRLTKNLMQAFV